MDEQKNNSQNSSSEPQVIRPSADPAVTPLDQTPLPPADAATSSPSVATPIDTSTTAAPSSLPTSSAGSDAPTASPVPAAPTQPKKSKSKMIVWVIAIIVVLLAAGTGYGAYMYKQSQEDKSSSSTVKVGLMMAFSGGSSTMGYGASKGIQLAKKQLGADNIEIVQEDSKCDPKTAAEAIKRLIAKKVVAIIGEGCSSASVAALPAANNAGIPMISPSASSPTLSIPDDYFFRVVPPDTLQGSFMAQYIYDQGITNAAVFYTNEPYGSGMNTVFRESFEALGGKVVATASAEPDVIDLAAQIQELKAANPGALFIAPNSVVTATAVIKLAREAGLNIPLFGADIMYDNTIVSNAGEAAEGLTISSFPTGTKSFKQALVNEYQKTEQLYAAPQAYDIIDILKRVTDGGATSGSAIKAALAEINFEGVSATIKFDRNGEISDKDYKYDLFEVKDGAFELVNQ